MTNEARQPFDFRFGAGEEVQLKDLEYGVYYDVIGPPSRHRLMPQLRTRGYVVDITTVEVTFAVSPAISTSTNVQGLRFFKLHPDVDVIALDETPREEVMEALERLWPSP